ncbi:acyl-CoA dehydrogenase family protein [Deinococcus multiflagellatus]|uniref:Acyl-CoA dehydrogenase family protein n=1 Tax=Deinococcus multiflagellatus TaxID=1656887 RepID=A0ABW1ZSH3_9DEIO
MPPVLNRRDLQFQLFEVLDTAALPARPRFASQTRADYEAVLALAAEVAERFFAPHAREADEHEPVVREGRVVLPAAAARAMQAFREAGFFSAHHDEEFGGLALPWVVTQAAMAHFQAANLAWSGYPFLTIGNANLQRQFASPEQQRRYLQPLLEGRWFGTMALSEPQAGSGLADIATTATPGATAPTPSTAPRCGFPAASTNSPRTSCIWCWPVWLGARRACAASACFWCRATA